jgi:hypothetical protein
VADIRSSLRGQDEIVIFESFEASPLSEKVLAAENALQWDFPRCAVAIPYSVFDDTSFQDNLAAFLEQASTESIKHFAAFTNKAGSFTFESRDTVDPSLITQMLMTLLEVNGHRIFPRLLRKRVRDEVCWTDGAEKPWRRCAYWLVLRVGLQRHLYTLHGGEDGRAHYKFLLCLVLARLIDNVLDHLSPDLLACLKAKLTRRLAKLEVDRSSAATNVRSVYELMFATLGRCFHKTTEKASEHIEMVWNDFKKTIRRPVQLLPRYADQAHLLLTLPNSGIYLQQVLSWDLQMDSRPQSFTPHRLPVEFDVSVAATNNFRVFANRCFSLSQLETEIGAGYFAAPTSTIDHEMQCMKLARKIATYLNTVCNAYDSNPEQKSIMLLTVMKLWMLMDQSATKLFDLLMEYNPGIPPETLDVLQLPHFKDMFGLKEIEEYLRDRYTKCNLSHKTIFDDPVKGCFADRYYDKSKDSQRLQKLHQSIEIAAEFACKKKEEEWQDLSKQFEELGKMIAESTCLYTTDDIRVIHDDRKCQKCYLQRKAKRMRIRIHEHPLPSNFVQAKAVVFEFGCPEAFTAYRNATWMVLATLARPKQMECREPKLVIRDYSELKPFINSKGSGVSLASTTKSFLSTHYNGVHFPVSLDNVCLPNGLRLGYFDPLTKIWPGRQTQTPTFAHHCQMTIPKNSPFSSLQFSPDFAVDANGPSSYEVLASQTRCPSGLNMQGFMAYQALFSGKSRRWPLMLIELGSSNLNFSTEAVTLLMTQLALQAGPAYELDPLRTIHRIFRHETFCKRLMEQIGQRLDVISFNWRETNCMEMLLTLILRLCYIASEPIVSEAVKLLEKARATTFKWMSQLRLEIHRATDAVTSRRCSRYAFWAALLCRRTFAVHAIDVDAGKSENLQAAALQCFIGCSITLQDNLVGDPASLPALARNALIRDLKMVYQMRFILRQSLRASPKSLESAINDVWSQPEGEISRSYSGLIFLEAPDEWWIQSTVHATRQTMQQTIHYHMLEGHLAIDGQPMGKLPAKHRESVILEQLFGMQSLLTYPSGLRGMTYMLACDMNGHQIHIGLRNDALIIQACVRGTVLELVPHGVFGDPSNFDLPTSLVENCVHWLDLRTGIMEVRQQPDIWMSKKSNWLLDFNARVARRRKSSLVDPHSPLFQHVARIFERFEHRGRLTVFQPECGSLSVELRRLELSFFVNSKRLLQCRQLRSEISPDQDAGTWYGLNSKLVLRDAINPRQRSIIVPIGLVRYKRNGFHVAVNVENGGSYGRFTINDVLGRLDCPTEPRLLYLKAQFHAYTSFIVPDPLTGRTGAEEALHCLKSGYCQPWTPLNPGPLQILMSIAELTPKREYYPQDMKTMQHVFWNPHLTTAIQRDEFRPIVQAIYEKSKKLYVFAFKKTELPSLERARDPPHLLHRSFSRRRLYQRPNPDFDGQQAALDLPYDSRHRYQAKQGCLNVFESLNLIRNWAPEMPTTPDLAGILQNWATIGGYDRSFDKFLLSDLIDVQFALEWGSLVNLCRTSGPQDKYRLMFLFAVMSFGNNVEMNIIRTLIAFVVLEDLKPLDPPKWPSYLHFRQIHNPSVDYLIQLIKPCCVPYPGDERGTFHFNVSSKQRRKLEAAELRHEQQTESDCKALAKFFLDQWPCSEPMSEEFFKPGLVDVPRALEIIRPEWLRLFQNMELSHHLQQVQLVLDRRCTGRKIEPPKLRTEDQEVLPTRCRGGELPSLSRNLLRKTGPIMSKELYPIVPKRYEGQITTENDKIALSTLQKKTFPNSLQKPVHVKSIVPSFSPEIQELESIINGITNSHSTVQQQYGRDLKQSLDALKIFKSAPKQNDESILPAKMFAEISRARQAVNEQFDHLCVAFERNDLRAQWLKKGGLWPCITSITLLEQLRSTSASVFGDGMKESLVAYAVSITVLQRLLRIEDAHLKANKQTLLEEQKNSGHENWQPLKNPDWLLLEIDANILIRPDQVDVALATISPTSRSNSVLQMNMGQGEFASFDIVPRKPFRTRQIRLTQIYVGKTSCIMPMVATVLADTKKLLRVVVPKALLLQTAQLLQARLGGLLGREVGHVPFSRKTPTNPESSKAFFNIHKEARVSSGVILALPEHILSFMLSGLQRLSDERDSEATQMVKVQAWMRKVCRDVLDECDFTLAVGTQMIYPSGSQTTVDGHPHRWETAEALLRLVEGHLWNLHQDFPHSIEVVRRPHGGFPVAFFLRRDVEDALIARLVKDIFSGQTEIVPTRECTQSDRLAIKQFISDAHVRPAVAERIRQMFPDKPAAKQNLYLLRGLLVHRILLLALKKRWNVQYGLHPNRDPMAVPFHAKGVPSEQAEWGHPDVAILFTCLAFYYGGLDLAQLRQSLEHLVKSDDPSGEYDRWIHTSQTLPDSLRDWNVINVDDEAQQMEIWQHLRYKVVVIDYFLNHFVFPKHAKQFRMKLQASGWDIPLFSPGSQSLTGQESVGNNSQPLTTGFSGTNDNRAMLPLTINQEDLRGLSHTNAEVLTYLLQPRSRTYVHAADDRGRHLSELDLLRMLSDRKIRMLIDAGAQILEMDNLSLAKAWLKIDHEAPAALYFNAENKPFVVYRHGNETPLLASPFAENLGDCLVYLDEAHTRGTDLKMPADARGALTLGLGQTKDQTVQGPYLSSRLILCT